MILRRFAALGILLSGAAALSACTALSQLTPPNPNVSNARVFSYTAIGASDAVGFGASVPCPTAAVVIGSDTEQMPSPASCPSGTGYVPDIVHFLQTGVNTVALTDLGISGAVIGPTERTLGNTWEPFVDPTCGHSGQAPCIPGDFITDELPLIPSQQNTVTIFAGGNDTNAIFAHVAVACASCTPLQIQSMIAADLTNFLTDYQTLLVTVHARFPFARIYAANLPNFGLIPRGVALGGQAQALLDAISTNMDYNVNPVTGTHGINVDLPAAGIPVVDIECDPQSYNPSNFFTDGFHPNDSGYALLAAKYAPAILTFFAPPPAITCPPYSLSKTRHPLSGKIGHVHLLRY
jgi:lysophospholipase L1-like esterase